MMIPENLNKLIDGRNYRLWSELKKSFHIQVVKQIRTDSKIFIESRSATIYVQRFNLNPASFTHELLHIWLLANNVRIGDDLIYLFRTRTALKPLFSPIGEFITNCTDHVKMFPEYIKLGYQARFFTNDYSNRKLTNKAVSKISKRWSDQILDARVIQDYIGYYFAAVFSQNKSFDYTIHLSALENIAPDLFHILDTFSNAWLDFNIEVCKEHENAYQEIVLDFISSIEAWITSKGINS